MPDTIKQCRNCGKDFKASPNDYTVNCPECRQRKNIKVTRSVPYSQKEVSPRGKTCTVTTAVGGKCGKPAVYAFESSTGEVFAECKDHH